MKRVSNYLNTLYNDIPTLKTSALTCCKPNISVHKKLTGMHGDVLIKVLWCWSAYTHVQRERERESMISPLPKENINIPLNNMF